MGFHLEKAYDDPYTVVFTWGISTLHSYLLGILPQESRKDKAKMTTVYTVIAE